MTLVRLLSMRRTLFAVSAELAPYVEASTAHAIAVKERSTLLAHLEEDGGGLDARWLAPRLLDLQSVPLDRRPDLAGGGCG